MHSRNPNLKTTSGWGAPKYSRVSSRSSYRQLNVYLVRTYTVVLTVGQVRHQSHIRLQFHCQICASKTAKCAILGGYLTQLEPVPLPSRKILAGKQTSTGNLNGRPSAFSSPMLARRARIRCVTPLFRRLQPSIQTRRISITTSEHLFHNTSVIGGRLLPTSENHPPWRPTTLRVARYGNQCAGCAALQGREKAAVGRIIAAASPISISSLSAA
jgi:hypothetical protein